MSGPLELERVVFLENIDKPLNTKGEVPGLDKVFDADPRSGMRHSYRLQLVGAFVKVSDYESGHFEMVPVSLVRQMREMREVTAKRVAEREEKRRAVPAPASKAVA